MPEDDAQDQTPTLIRDLVGWYSFTLLGFGMRSGLLDALMAGPATTPELAARAGVDERNAYEWLRGLTAGGHALHQDGAFTISPETSFLLSPEFAVDMRAVLGITLDAPALFDDVIEAMRTGAGVPSQKYGQLGSAAGRVNTPTYAAALVQEWIELVPGMSGRLRDGARAADIAAGNGDAAALVATAFPAAQVVAYDVLPSTRAESPTNLTTQVADVRELPDDGPFDLVYCLDAFHHSATPSRCSARCARCWRTTGC